ncbi:MAG: ribonuclease PH, partial [Proteobacteria bacterium]|nr:ribonuclease PH [Pseudomonadota bacterium]
SPLVDSVAAVSVGMVDGKFLLDLDYSEDVGAQVDFNVAMTGSGHFIEVQGTAEGATFNRKDMDRMMNLAALGIRELKSLQDRALRRRPLRMTWSIG